jgi:hypothetical protein
MKMYLSVMFIFMNIKIGTQLPVKASDIIFHHTPTTHSALRQEHADGHSTGHNLPYKHSVYVPFVQNE